MSAGELGSYLRARREAVPPESVGVATGARRRVAGLRREEVALLAGISAEYYVRLEQGRERNPSPQVVAGLVRALALDRPAEDFLRALAGQPPSPRRSATTDPGLVAFLDALSTTPAMAHDRVLTVVASNRLARGLTPAFTPGVNLLRAALFDPGLRSLYQGAEEAIGRLVSYLRAQAAVPPPDPRLADLVAELSAASPLFALLWARQEVVPAANGVNLLLHERYGALELRFERLTPAGSDDPVVVVYHAAPGSATERALEALARDQLGAAAALGAEDGSATVRIHSSAASATSGQPESSVKEWPRPSNSR
ncbi:helix-turn-helix protein [Amnibacterium kyonggiense]|uniref:Helix-turn-helix protein n=1 Tax=Amnibacterium kyonggiense TaxID=595671 RepID=A0A4R7FHY0_9MICO|nr:helix-turn-helix protein [Amnibacterium kyonggiense]